ncbi:MAG: nitrilase-related carbon-nitrogen hydrolase [Bdellovibrionota bacterium]
MRIAAVQMRSTDDPWWNLQQVADFLEVAKRESCDLICFPENVFYRGSDFRGLQEAENFLLELNDDLRIKTDSDFSKELAGIVESCPLAISFGSVRQASEKQSGKFENSHWYINREKRVFSYSKIHLFEFGENYRESDEIDRGESALVVEAKPFWLGLSICYDLRFPEFYRWMTLGLGANVLLIPAAFTKETGEVHWEVLLKARAIENQAYVAASAQWGDHLGSKGQALSCFGHSMLIDPWGRILKKADAEGDDLLISDFNFDEVRAMRSKLPALEHSFFKVTQPEKGEK